MRVAEGMTERSGATETDEPVIRSGQAIRRLWALLVGFELLLVFLDATVNYGEGASSGAIQRLFNITREDALANWFQSAQTLAAAGVLWLIALQTRGESGALWTRRGWLLLAVFFAYLAVDDGAKIHERVGTAIDDLSVSNDDGVPTHSPRFASYTWQVVFVPLFGLMGLFAFFFLWAQFKARDLRVLLILGLGGFVVAVGLDYVEGLDGGYDRLIERFASDEYTVSHFAKALEEWIEMVGTTCLLMGFLTHLMRKFPLFAIRFT